MFEDIEHVLTYFFHSYLDYSTVLCKDYTSVWKRENQILYGDKYIPINGSK